MTGDEWRLGKEDRAGEDGNRTGGAGEDEGAGGIDAEVFAGDGGAVGQLGAETAAAEGVARGESSGDLLRALGACEPRGFGGDALEARGEDRLAVEGPPRLDG